MFWLIANAAAAQTPCITMDLLRSDPLIRRGAEGWSPDGARSTKQEREAMAELPNQLASDNFVVKWGDSGGVQQSEVEDLLSAFEDSWAYEVVLMEHRPPYGTDSYLFNVYIGDSGSGAPSSYGASGYYYGDDDGWPMIVVAASTLDDQEYSDITASHEFYHALQGETGRYDYSGGVGSWFWEATATWASAQVYPSNVYYASFLFSYVFLPHYPVNFFDYPDEGLLQEFYQYGSYIFPQHLSQETAGHWVISDAWKDSGSEEDPMEVMRGILAEDGLDLDELWLDHIARLAYYDYGMGSLLAEYVGYYEAYDESENQLVGEHWGEGTSGLLTPPDGLLPMRYGFNTIRLYSPSALAHIVRIEGDEDGSATSPARFGARVLLRSAATIEYLDVPFDGTIGELEFVPDDDVQEVTLVVGAWTEHHYRMDREVFPYRYSIEPVLPAPSVPDEEVETPVKESGCFKPSSLSILCLPLALYGYRRSTAGTSHSQRPAR
jgi:hypothetical protein